jgi:hypothetical protein
MEVSQIPRIEKSLKREIWYGSTLRTSWTRTKKLSADAPGQKLCYDIR